MVESPFNDVVGGGGRIQARWGHVDGESMETAKVENIEKRRSEHTEKEWIKEVKDVVGGLEEKTQREERKSKMSHKVDAWWTSIEMAAREKGTQRKKGWRGS